MINLNEKEVGLNCWYFFSSAKPIRPGQHPGGSPATGTGIRGGGGMAVNGPQ